MIDKNKKVFVGVVKVIDYGPDENMNFVMDEGRLVSIGETFKECHDRHLRILRTQEQWRKLDGDDDFDEMTPRFVDMGISQVDRKDPIALEGFRQQGQVSNLTDKLIENAKKSGATDEDLERFREGLSSPDPGTYFMTLSDLLDLMPDKNEEAGDLDT